jgi:2,3-dihydroxybenzoate decarboxylase
VAYIALEEAFSIPELAAHQPASEMRIRVTAGHASACGRKLADFEEYRLPDMDEHGIDIQVLSLTVPGIEADTDAGAARDNAKFANDFLADAVGQHPTRFRGFAALPMQDPQAAVRELVRSVTELGFVGALVNDHAQDRYLDDPAYDDLVVAAGHLLSGHADLRASARVAKWVFLPD